MFYWFATFCTIFTFSCAAETYLLERLSQAQTGDFIVLEAGKTITLLGIRSVNEHSLVIEEISAPCQRTSQRAWAEWIQKRAPGHTSWSMIEIDLKSKEIVEAYSFSRAAWISTAPKDSFLAGLLGLPLHPMPKDALRRIGPPPLESEPDQRKIWAPPLFVEGKQVESVSFDALETTWPDDGSEFAGKVLNLYFNKEGLSPFPYWIQIDTGQITAALRAIDSGHKLPPSLYRTIPKRAPEFVNAPVKTQEGGLRFTIKSPKYYKEFELFAIDVTSQNKQIHLLNHKVSPGKDCLYLDIEADELLLQLEPEHAYTWLITPIGVGTAYSEFSKPLVWSLN